MKKTTILAIIIFAATPMFYCFFAFSHLTNRQEPIRASFKLPIIIHNEKPTDLCLSPNHMFNAWYDIERMEEIDDTLNMLEDGLPITTWYQFDVPATDSNGVVFSNKELKLVVDTVNQLTMLKEPIWASYLFNSRWRDDQDVRQDDSLVQYVKSFPIYVANNSTMNSALITIQDGSLMMVAEAQNDKSEWKKIEYWSHSWCGNSYFQIPLGPNRYFMTRGIKCSGDFYTKCRMKLFNGNDSLVSNEFYMTINKTQFEKPILKDE